MSPAHAGMDTMILTHITLDPHQALPQSDLTGMGRRVRDSVDAETGANPALWARPAPTRLVIVSDIAPDWPLIPGAQSATSTRMPTHKPGDRVGWTITFSATRTVVKRGPDGRAVGRGRKVDLRDLGDATGWLTDRLTPALNQMGITDRKQLPRPEGAPKRWRIHGTGTVRDPEVLADLQAEGVGRNKAQGCGLLLTWEE